jgi:phosphoribosylformylglycinamidine cyclo-ligase
MLGLARDGLLHAAAHVTGGGIVENLPRCLPEGFRGDVAWGSWPVPAIFELVRVAAEASEEDLRSTFNLGIGMVLVVPSERAGEVVARAGRTGVAAFAIGAVRA